MTSRTDSRIKSTPSPARNASSSSDATDWDNAIGGNLPGEYLPVHTENPADGPLTQAGSPTARNPTTPGDSHVLESISAMPGACGHTPSFGLPRPNLWKAQRFINRKTEVWATDSIPAPK